MKLAAVSIKLYFNPDNINSFCNYNRIIIEKNVLFLLGNSYLLISGAGVIVRGLDV